MKTEVEVLEVRERTDELLDRVEKGETVVITQRGKPMADLVPHTCPPSPSKVEADA